MTHGDFDLNSNTNVAHGGLEISNSTPTLSSHLVNKEYVDNNINHLDIKASCRVATEDNVNINLNSAPISIDSIVLILNDRVLVKSETNPAQNGIYIFNGVGNQMTRARDADSGKELSRGSFCHIEEGSTNGGSGFVLTTPSTPSTTTLVIGTTPLTYSKMSAAAPFTTSFTALTTIGSATEPTTTNVAGHLTVGASGAGKDVTFFGNNSNSIGLKWSHNSGSNSAGTLLLGTSDYGVDFIAHGNTVGKSIKWDAQNDK